MAMCHGLLESEVYFADDVEAQPLVCSNESCLSSYPVNYGHTVLSTDKVPELCSMLAKFLAISPEFLSG